MSDDQAMRARDTGRHPTREDEEAQAQANRLTALPTGGRATEANLDHVTKSPTHRLSDTKRKSGFSTVLHNRLFLRLWMAQLISQVSLNAANYGLIILIQTQVQSLTATAGAIVMFALPALFFGAPAGVLVDRFNRRTVLWVSNLLRAAVSLLFVFSLVADRSALIPAYLMAFSIATISQFFAPAEGAAIPLLVHSDELINALSLFNVTFTLAQAVGMILLAPLIILFVPTFYIGTAHHGVQIIPVESLFAILGVMYLICTLLVLTIPERRLHPSQGRASHPLRQQGQQVISFWHSALESWHFVRRDQILAVSVLQLAFAGSFIAVIAMIAPRFVTEFFHQPPALAALVFIPAGAGLVIGSVLVPRFALRMGYNQTVLVGVVTLALSAVLLPFARALTVFLWAGPDWWNVWPYRVVVLVLTFIIGMALDLINVPAQTIMQERSPDWIKGRVLALQAMLLNAVTIPFVLIMGRVADVYSLMPAMEALGILIAVIGLASVYWGRRGELAEQAQLERDKAPDGPPS